MQGSAGLEGTPHLECAQQCLQDVGLPCARVAVDVEAGMDRGARLREEGKGG